MRSTIGLLTLALLVLPLGGAQTEGLLEPTRYIVGFYELPENTQTYLGEPVVAIDRDLTFFVVETLQGPLFEVRAKLQDEVRYVEWDNPNYAILNLVPNDSRYNDAGHWGSKKIGGEAAWDRTLGSTAVKVGMLDSGLYKAHEEWSGQTRVLQGYDFQNNDNDPNDQSGCSWHGSHTTGTAGATINNAKGIAGMSQHTILPVKAFYPGFFGCTAGTTPLVNALKYIGDQGSHISSNSWGSSATSTALNDAVQYAHDRGVIHVAAAGNSGPCTNCVSYPWKDKSTITIVVSSTTSTDAQSSFSSEGPQVDVAAPGSSILSLCGTSTTCYQTLSGTSMATPHVAGTAALVKTLNPSFTFTDVDNCLKNTALDLGAAGKDDDFGYGRIRADQAVNCGGGGGPTVPGAPTGLSASGGNAQVTLTWTAPASDGGASITNYKVYRGTSSGGETLYTTLGVVTSYTDAGVTNGVTYYYQVSAVNSVGESARSNEASATPQAPSGPALNENFDDGVANGWTLSGLWRVSGACTSNEPSAPNVLNYNQAPSPCTYSTGARTTGSAQSPAMDISAIAAPTLSITHGYIKENYAGGDYDIMRIQVQTAGSSTWTTLWQRDSTDPNQSSWTSLSLSLSSYKSTGTKIRFFFDSVDSFDNGYLGWVIDNVLVQ